MLDKDKSYEQLDGKLQTIASLNQTLSVLHWDQEVNLPPESVTSRSKQISVLSGLIHEMSTAEDIGILLERLMEGGPLEHKRHRNAQLVKKGYDKATRFDKDFIERRSKVTNESFHAWVKAKKENDFSIFEPHLKKVVDITKEYVDVLGYEDHPYDTLLDVYEPEAKTEDITALFKDVRAQLVDYVKELSGQKQVQDEFLFKHFDKDAQYDFGVDMLKQMLYDFKTGRQDISAHPFTTSFSSNDVRVTTRIDENNFSEMLWSCIHEGGHALYEQGLPYEESHWPSGEAVSLGIHESQSRLWENNVGRSLSYWKANYGKLQSSFPENLGKVDLLDFYKAINKVHPSLIRTNADELTYHFHIMIRFEIEKALMEGSVQVKDLPDFWNKKYKDYLGLDVPDLTQGILQDVHWSHGSLGYFPTYSLGSFYAAQFYQQAEKDIAHLNSSILEGNMKPLLDWLREKIHRHGSTFSATELCEQITGEKLNFSYFMNYARQKYDFIYGINA